MRFYVFLLVLAMVPLVSSLELDSGSFDLFNQHLGLVGDNGSTSSYTFRSTTTFEQPGNQNATTSTYESNVGHFDSGINIPCFVNLTGPANQTIISIANVTLNYTVSDEDDDNMSCWLYVEDTNPPTSIVNTSFNLVSGSNVSYEYTNFSRGIYYWRVVCSDQTINSSSQIWAFSYPIVITTGGHPGTGLTINKPVEEWTYVINDGVCQYSLGEDRTNSPQDCKPSFLEYAKCLTRTSRCYDGKMRFESLIGFLAFILLCMIMYETVIKKRLSQNEITEKKKGDKK